jgi:hypothetical protein
MQLSVTREKTCLKRSKFNRKDFKVCCYSRSCNSKENEKVSKNNIDFVFLHLRDWSKCRQKFVTNWVEKYTSGTQNTSVKNFSWLDSECLGIINIVSDPSQLGIGPISPRHAVHSHEKGEEKIEDMSKHEWNFRYSLMSIFLSFFLSF